MENLGKKSIIASGTLFILPIKSKAAENFNETSWNLIFIGKVIYENGVRNHARINYERIYLT